MRTHQLFTRWLPAVAAFALTGFTAQAQAPATTLPAGITMFYIPNNYKFS